MTVSGQLIGTRYRIQNKIGEGGMASVYVAIDEKLQRRVAIKILHEHMANNKDIRQRFFQEAQAISTIDHPNILKIFDFSGEASSQLWMVTEILRGNNLSEYVRDLPDKRMHPMIALLFVNEILQALDAAHREGIVHRDIKPENIMVLRSGGLKLMDFGISKNTRTESITVTGTFMGSPSYMSPEQIRSAEIDHRSDIYSLGVLAYEIITAKLPYIGLNTHDVVMKICAGKFIEPINLVPSLAPDINIMICKAMALHSSDRYQQVRSFSDDIAIFLKNNRFATPSTEISEYFKDRAKYEARLQQTSFTSSASIATSNFAVSNKNSIFTQSHESRQQPQHQRTAMNESLVQQQKAIYPPRINKTPRAKQRGITYKIAHSKKNRSAGILETILTSIAILLLLIAIFIGFAKLAPRVNRAAEIVRKKSNSSLLTDNQIKQPAKPIQPTNSSIPTKENLGSRDNNSVNSKQKNQAKEKTTKKSTSAYLKPKPSIRSDSNPIPAKSSVPNLNSQNPKITPPPASLNQQQATTSVLQSPSKSINFSAFIRVSSQPAAEIYINGSRVGTTIDATTSSNWIRCEQAKVSIVLRRTGYVEQSFEIKINNGERRSLDNIKLQLLSSGGSTQ